MLLGVTGLEVFFTTGILKTLPSSFIRAYKGKTERHYSQKFSTKQSWLLYRSALTTTEGIHQAGAIQRQGFIRHPEQVTRVLRARAARAVAHVP